MRSEAGCRTLARATDVAVPRWSPDGCGLPIWRVRQENGIRAALRSRARAATTVRLTHARGDVIDAAWSPDGATIAYVAADRPGSGAVLLRRRQRLHGDRADAARPPLDRLRPAGGAPRRLTSGSWTIAPTDPGGIFSPQIAWTRDGRRITFTRVENTFSGDDERSTLWQVDVATRRDCASSPAHAELELSPAYSPDGSALAYWYPLNGDFNSENTLRLVGGGRDRPARAERLDRNVAGSLWFPDGAQLAGLRERSARKSPRGRSISPERCVPCRSAIFTSSAIRTRAARSMPESPPTSRATARSPSSRRARRARASCTICPPGAGTRGG